MAYKNICIVSECQQILGVGGTETVSFLLKQEFINNGYNVWSLYLIPKATQTETDVELPDKQDICSIENKRVFIETITKNRIEVIISQGAPCKTLLDLCIEAKKATETKLIYSYHFNPLKATREYDDYKESVDERIRMFKIEFDKMKKNNLKYLKALYQAYRCKFPQNVCDCPVIKAIETSGICGNCIEEQDIQ